MVDWWYYNNLFAVEDGLFYEDGKRLSYFQEEKEDEILKNNHKATVDRMLELRELNTEFKRINKKLERENKELNEQLYVMKSNGLKVLEFYEYKLKNADREESENAREELWIVKEVLCEMGMIKDD